MGFLAAMAVLFSTDTGLYVSVCLAVYLLIQRRLLPEAAVGQVVNLPKKPPNVPNFGGYTRFVGATLLSFSATLLLGLGLASRGTLLQPEFWAEWTATLRTYGTGLNNLPIASMVQDDSAAGFFLMVMLLCNLFVVCRMLQEAVFRLTPRHLLRPRLPRNLSAVKRQANSVGTAGIAAQSGAVTASERIVVGLVGLYGLETLLLFVGRSHPYNLHHPSIPFCVVLVGVLAEICGTASQKLVVFENYGRRFLFRAAIVAAPCIIAYVLLSLVCVHPAFQSYPNVLQRLGQGWRSDSHISDENYLFFSLRDCPLPDGSRGHVADFRAITAAMRELSEGGRRNVAMIDSFETAYLVEADLRPCFRYSPVIHSLIFKDQAKVIERQLADNPPDYVFSSDDDDAEDRARHSRRGRLSGHFERGSTAVHAGSARRQHGDLPPPRAGKAAWSGGGETERKSNIGDANMTRTVVSDAAKSPKDKAPVNETLPVLRLGPIVLALVVGLQFTLWTWALCGSKTPDPEYLERFTEFGTMMYHPDYDVPVYFGGLACSLLLALAVNLLWRWRLRAMRRPNQWRRVQLNLLLHFPMACVLVLLPLFRVSARDLNPVCGWVGLAFCLVSLWAAGRSRRALRFWLYWPPICRHCAEAVIIIATVVLIVYVPNSAELASRTYLMDHYHHTDFFVMAPALAYSHGLALETDFYSQYGVGWPMVLAFLSKLGVPLSYGLFFHVCAVWGCVYFLSLYMLLRLLFHSVRWAAIGLFVALLLQLYGGAFGVPKWQWPASSIMRYPMDMLFFIACLLYANTGKRRFGALMGFFAAMAMVFSTDTGLYASVCLGVCLLAVGTHAA